MRAPDGKVQRSNVKIKRGLTALSAAKLMLQVQRSCADRPASAVFERPRHVGCHASPLILLLIILGIVGAVVHA